MTFSAPMGTDPIENGLRQTPAILLHGPSYRPWTRMHKVRAFAPGYETKGQIQSRAEVALIVRKGTTLPHIYSMRYYLRVELLSSSHQISPYLLRQDRVCRRKELCSFIMVARSSSSWSMHLSGAKKRVTSRRTL